MSVELGDDVTYPVRGVDSISFLMILCDVLEINDVLFVPDFKNNIHLVSHVEYVYVEFHLRGNNVPPIIVV